VKGQVSDPFLILENSIDSGASTLTHVIAHKMRRHDGGKRQIILSLASGATYAGLEPVLAFRCAMTPWGLKLHTHVLSQTRGEPCAVCQSRWTAAAWSYDCLAKGDLHHSYRQGCVANMADVMIGSILNYCSAIAMLRYRQMVGAVIQSQIPCAGTNPPGAFM